MAIRRAWRHGRWLLGIGLLALAGSAVWPETVSRWLVAGLRLDTRAWWVPAALDAWAIRRLALILGGIAAGTLLLAAGARACGGLRQRAARLHACDRGTAMIEFTLVLPIALLIFLVVLQTSLLYEARFHVSLAAFRGARSAMVWSPVYYNPVYPPKVPPEVVQRAAAAAIWTCAPISGTYPCSVSDGGFAGLAEQTWRDFLPTAQPWLGEHFVAQFQYSMAHTRVNLYYDAPTMPGAAESAAEQWAKFWAGREPINTRVEHDFQLRVPYAARILAERKLGDGLYVVRLKSNQLLLNDTHGELLNGAVP